jgi:hypothetical protein
LTNTKRLGRFSRSDYSHSSLNQLTSLYEDASWTQSLLELGKPLFLQQSPLEKILAHANRTAEKSRKFLDKVESKKQSSIDRSKLLPENATIRQEYIKCGKTSCYHGKHGPYYYAYWKDPQTKRLKKKYIGQYFQSFSEEKRQASTNDIAQVT